MSRIGAVLKLADFKLDGSTLSREQEDVLEVAIRIANTAWFGGQDERDLYDDNAEQIRTNPLIKDNYQPFNQMVATSFKKGLLTTLAADTYQDLRNQLQNLGIPGFELLNSPAQQAVTLADSKLREVMQAIQAKLTDPNSKAKWQEVVAIALTFATDEVFKDVQELPKLKEHEVITTEQLGEQELEKLAAAEELVADNYNYDLTADIAKVCQEAYPGYPEPEHKIKLSSEEIDEVLSTDQQQLNYARLVEIIKTKYGEAKLKELQVYAHKNYLQGVLFKQQGISPKSTREWSIEQLTTKINELGVKTYQPGENVLEQVFTESWLADGYLKDENGTPVHHHARTMLENGFVLGPGFYWDYGPNTTADPVLIVPSIDKNTNKLVAKMVMITRADTKQLALPGGFADPTDSSLKAAALRELFEEAGIKDFNIVKSIEVINCPVADVRATLNAWPETSVNLFIPDQDIVQVLDKLTAGDDASKVHLETLSQEVVEQMFGSHGNFTKLAILRWEEYMSQKLSAQQGKQVKLKIAADGQIKVQEIGSGGI